MAETPQYPGAPRWVKGAGIAAAIVALVVVITALIGGGHGPQRHFGGHEGAPADAGR